MVSLLLALVVQPLLGAVGELHELTHVTGPAGHHAEHGALADELANANESENGDAATLHVIHHLVHCCGQTAAMTPMAPLLPTRPRLSTSRFAFRSQPVAMAHLTGVFRPPIAA